MPVIAQDRPLHALRTEAIDRLIMNYGHGRLSLEAFERRLDEALDAENHQTLEALTADLDLEVDERFIAQKKVELGLAGTGSLDRRIEHVVNVFSGGGRSGPCAGRGRAGRAASRRRGTRAVRCGRREDQTHDEGAAVRVREQPAGNVQRSAAGARALPPPLAGRRAGA